MKMKVKLPFNFSIGRLLFNKRFAVVFSLVLSFVIWLSVMINQNPVREQVFTDIAANISIDNTAASDMGLGIVSDVTSQKFTVTVSGPNYVVSSLTSEDFILSADVSEVNTVGTHSLTVYGNRNSSKTGYTFKSITPSSIDVKFDYIDSKDLTLVPKLIGVSAGEGLVAETPVVANSKQSELTVKGPRSIVEKIASAGTYFEVNKALSSTQTFDSQVVLYDQNNEILYQYLPDGTILDNTGNAVQNNYLSLSYTSVKITQPISKKATLPVKVTFKNLPSGITAEDVSLKIDHKTVTVIGTPDVISELEEIALSPIDFTEVSTNSSEFNVPASLKDGVRLFDSIDFFKVRIDTSGFAEKTFTISNIKCTGLDSKFTVKSDSSIKNVKICGPKKTVSEITASDLYAVADLSDKSEGSHTVQVVVKSDNHSDVWQVGSYSIAVNISSTE
ncbi:MAG: hypothetical protein J5659_02325 [Clostridia bacterium]|nr:hypothetical protein [Clostridia bacterium]